MSKVLKTLYGPLSTFKKNRNGRVYSKQLWENVLNSEYWSDMMTNNTMCGEIVHPGDRTESDVFEIDARNISHRIKEAHIEGDKLMGTVEVLDTEQGHNLLNLINAGCVVGISARGMGDLNGDEVDPDTYNFKCFDITMRPSDPNARLVPLTESEQATKLIVESELSDRLIEAGYEKPNFSDTSDVVKNTLNKRLFTELQSRNLKDITFTKNLAGIRATKGDDHITYLIVKGNPDKGQPLTYAIFPTKNKTAWGTNGYYYIHLNDEGYPSVNYKDLADAVIDHINNTLTEDQMTLDI